jgi:hypothetical protein
MTLWVRSDIFEVLADVGYPHKIDRKAIFMSIGQHQDHAAFT